MFIKPFLQSKNCKTVFDSQLCKFRNIVDVTIQNMHCIFFFESRLATFVLLKGMQFSYVKIAAASECACGAFKNWREVTYVFQHEAASDQPNLISYGKCPWFSNISLYKLYVFIPYFFTCFCEHLY